MPNVVARGVRFNYSTLGQGDDLVLLIHGLFVDNHASWYLSAAPVLTPHCKLVMHDLRGHGLSERPKSGYTLEDHVLDAAAVLDELGLGDRKVTVVGNSFGGRIALAFGVRFPERVRSLVIVDSHPADTEFTELMAETLPLPEEERKQRIREIWENWTSEVSIDRGMADRDAIEMRQRAEAFGKRKLAQLSKALWQLAYETSFIDDVRAASTVSDADLAGLTCPVLALYGEESHLRATGERLNEIIPDCTFRVVPGCAHFVLSHRPDIVREALLDWIVGAPTPS